jgi:hypothetical protein
MRGNYGWGVVVFSPVRFEHAPKDLPADAEKVFFVANFVGA